MLALLVLVFAAVTAIASSSAPQDYRLLGKYDAPYHVALLINWEFMCSGAIITKNVVVSTSQCYFRPPRMYKVRAGSTDCYVGGQLIDVRRVIVHELYHEQYYTDYDIALFILDAPLLLDGLHVDTIPILTAEQHIAPGSSVILSGWASDKVPIPGYLINGKLASRELRYVDLEDCQLTYASVFMNITLRMICARSFDDDLECQSDAGSPLVQNGMLVGVKSWCLICGNPQWPTVFSSISVHSEWIENKLLTVSY